MNIQISVYECLKWNVSPTQAVHTIQTIHMFSNTLSHKIFMLIGPSRVRALPLGAAAEQSVHSIWYYFSFLSSSVPHTFLPEGVVLGL